jgi:hypothetical protein
VLNRGGGRVLAGDYDDARHWVSHTVQTTGRSEATIPAFEGTDAEWRAVLSCVRSEYRGLPVDFVEKPPTLGEYLLVMVGGLPAELGQVRLWGWSSTGMRAVVPNGVGFVFSAAHRAKDRTIALCETLTHEVGHMLGVAHSTDCDDVMSLNPGCKDRDYRSGRLRGFRPATWSVLVSSLAAWTKFHAHPNTLLIDNANHDSQETGALAVPQPD